MNFLPRFVYENNRSPVCQAPYVQWTGRKQRKLHPSRVVFIKMTGRTASDVSASYPPRIREGAFHIWNAAFVSAFLCVPSSVLRKHQRGEAEPLELPSKNCFYTAGSPSTPDDNARICARAPKRFLPIYHILSGRKTTSVGPNGPGSDAFPDAIHQYSTDAVSRRSPKIQRVFQRAAAQNTLELTFDFKNHFLVWALYIPPQWEEARCPV